MLLLSVETATDVCGIALHDASGLRAQAAVHGAKLHARALTPMMVHLLEMVDCTWQDVGAVAVSSGPGSYTGLRIGLSAAKGICFARDRALVAVPTLEAHLHTLLPHVRAHEVAVVVHPSRRGEVYAAWQRPGEPPTPAVAISVEALRDALPPGSCLLAGAGRHRIPPLPDARTVPALDAPSAVSVAALGWERWKSGHVESVADFEPDYLKPWMPGP